MVLKLPKLAKSPAEREPKDWASNPGGKRSCESIWEELL